MRANIIAVAGGTLALVLSSSGMANPASSRQRIRIDETLQAGGQAFVLTPLTAGSLKADSGTVTFVGGLRGSGLSHGQSFKRFAGVETFQGKHGVLRVPDGVVSTDVPHGYGVGVGTWRIGGGTGSYSGVSGGGRESVVGMPGGATLTRYEGYVRTG